MSVNPTSIQSGFARSRSEALFPRLFPDAGWWCPSLQSPGGSRLHDLSGRQNWGTLINMANNDWVVSGGRGALDLDGSNDHVPLYNGRLYDLTNQSLVYTISLWASTRNVVNTQHCFGDYNSSGVNNLFSIVFNFTTNGTLHAYGNGLGTEVLLTNALQSNVWYNIVIVRNGGSTYAAYLNGVFKGTSSSLNAVSAFSDQKITLGRPGAYAGLYFNGQLDDARIYNQALSAGEVRQLYQLGRGNMPRIRKRRIIEQAAGFKAYWANRRSRIIGAGI